MKRNALDLAGFVTPANRPNRAAAVKPDRRAGLVVLGAIVLVVMAVASPFASGDDAFSGCQHVQGSDGTTQEIPCSETTDENAGSLSPRDTP
jgi:hypothetical protein